MKILWLKINQSYVILFGDNVVDIDGKRFFSSIDEMKEWLKPKGLTVRNKRVVLI